MLTEKVKRDWHQSTAIVITRQAQSQGSTPRKPFFQFILVDKTAVVVVPFDQPQQVPLTALTWSISGSAIANATSYAVIIVDPDKTLPPTISVTLTPTENFAGLLIRVDPNPSLLPYTIPAALTDGSPNIVVHNNPANGVPQASAFNTGDSGTITITDTTTGTVTPLVVTVTANP